MTSVSPLTVNHFSPTDPFRHQWKMERGPLGKHELQYKKASSNTIKKTASKTTPNIVSRTKPVFRAEMTKTSLAAATTRGWSPKPYRMPHHNHDRTRTHHMPGSHHGRAPAPYSLMCTA